MNNNIKIKLNILLILFLSSTINSLLFSQIIEKVEVKGKIYSNELSSKNIVIISEEELNDLNVRDMVDLFSFFTIINVNKRGPSETSYDLTMRGSNFEQVLLLVNGVPLNNPQTGHFNTDLPFSIKDIKRVEIVSGGNSTSYGAGAFAGVINIILKRSSDFGFSLATGENNYLSSSINFGKRIKNTAFKFSFDKSNTSGFHEGRELDQTKLSTGIFYSNENMEMDFYSGFLKKNFGAMGFYAPLPSYEKISSFFYQLSLKKRLMNFNYSLSYFYNSHNDYFVLDRDRPDYFNNESNTKINYLNLSFNYKMKKIESSSGFEIKKEIMDSASMGYHKRNKGSLFLDLSYPFKNGGVDAGIRGDFIFNGEKNFTFYSGIYHSFSSNLIFRVGCGKSFRLPSFTELYYKSPANIGNVNLKPEISYNFETSISILKERQNMDLSLFYRKQKNIIDWVKYSEEEIIWHAMNIDKNDILGFELTHRINLGKTIIFYGIERIYTINEQHKFKSKYELRFPDLNIKINLLQKVTKNFKIISNYCYKRIYNTVQKGHFLNFSFSYSFQRFELNLRFDNLFNTIIEEIPGVKIPGKWIYLGLVYR